MRATIGTNARTASIRAASSRARPSIVCRASRDQLLAAREDVREMLGKTFSHPIMIRFAWHDSGTYNKDIKEWPACGGANGSLRFDEELAHGANAGLNVALNLLKPIKKKYDQVSWADLMQLTSAEAIRGAGGPTIPMIYGRVDSDRPHQDGNLPGAAPPFPKGERTPAEHLRNVFYRMGFTDKDIVALSGAHTMGRAYKERSGMTDRESTKYTEKGPGRKGGQSWTPEWLKFDNSYFVEVKAKRDADLLVMPSDACLFEDDGFRPHAEKYAASQADFFSDYAQSHKKLSELGAKFEDQIKLD